MSKIVRYVVLLGLVIVSLPLAAQRGRGGVGGGGGLGRGGLRPADALVHQRIVQILMNQARNTLALTDDQLPKVRRMVSDWAQQQLLLEQEERLMRESLDAQMRPGVAATVDSLPRLVYGISANRIRQAQSLDEETHQLGTILSPLQLAQFQLIQERLLKNIRDLPRNRQPPPEQDPSPS